MSSNTGVKKGSGFRSGRSRSSTDLLLLHLNILIFSFTGVFSKFAAESIRTNGLFSIRTILWGILIIANCGIYAIFWQYILKLFDVNEIPVKLQLTGMSTISGVCSGRG